MGLRTWLGLYGKTKFAGDWSHRLNGLLEAGIDFEGKGVLDVGCNMGVIAYEITKQRPTFIHGLDSYRAAIRTARTLFTAVAIESRFDVIDLTNGRKLERVLLPSYDVVLFLSVYQHVRGRSPDTAKRLTEVLAQRCSRHFLARVKAEHAEEFTGLVEAQGFQLMKGNGDERPILRFDRVVFGPAGPNV